eukprot:69469_1
MSSLYILNQLLIMIEKHIHVTKHITNTESHQLLNTLQRYKVVNPDDIMENKSPDMERIVSKYLSLMNVDDGRQYKLLVLIRHGEGEHNYAKYKVFGAEQWPLHSTNLKWKDARLTQTGIEQVKKILPQLKCLQPHLDFIVCSPLRRALQTAKHAVLPLVEVTGKCPVYVLEYSREKVNRNANDHRHNLDDIQEEWKDYDFQYQGFETNEDNQWNSKENETLQSLWKRGAKMMDFIWNTKGNVAVYSGHCDFIMSLMQVIVAMPYYKPKNGAYFPIIITTA